MHAECALHIIAYYYIGNSMCILRTKLIKPSQLVFVLSASNPSAPPPLMLSGSATVLATVITISAMCPLSASEDIIIYSKYDHL